jgi:hypothetical protein
MVVSTIQEQVDDTTDGRHDELRAILERQRRDFVAQGPPGVTVRRNRIDRLLALVLDNADEFVAAMDADLWHASKNRVVVHRDPRHDLGDRTRQIACAAIDAGYATNVRCPAVRAEGRGAALTIGIARSSS